MKNTFIMLKKGLGIIVLMIFFSAEVNAQKWTAMDKSSAEMHDHGTASATAFDINFNPCVIGGRNSTVTGNAVTYLWGFSNWEYAIGLSAREEAVSFSIKNKGYIIGGIDENGNYKNDVWEFDPVSLNWIQKNNFPGGQRAHAVAFVIGTKAYVGTGSNGNTLFNDFYEYDPSSDTWKTINSLPANERKDAIAFTADTMGYVGTGSTTSGTVMNDIWKYDPASGNWTQKNNFPGAARTSAVGLGLRNKGYITTGTNGTANYKDFWEYTAATDSWLQLADYPGEARNEAVAFVSGAKLCIVFGKNSAGTILNDCYYYKNSYKYDFTITPSKVCLGSPVVIKNLTNDPDAYNYIIDLPSGNIRKVENLDTVHITATQPMLSQGVMIKINEKNGFTPLQAVRRDFDITRIDSIGLTSLPDTCTGGVGVTLAKLFSPDFIGPYKYEWSNMITHNRPDDKDTLKGLSPGIISVTITDGGGCKASKSVMVGTFVDKPMLSIHTVDDTCTAKVGQIKVFPKTIKLPYSYSWSNGETTAMISKLVAGKYVVNIQDKNGCVAKDSSLVPMQYDSIKIAFTSIDASCNAADGSISATVSAGTKPYTYLWSNNENKETIDHLTAGNYTIQVTDKYGCTANENTLVKTSDIVSPPAICMVTVDSISKNNVIIWEKTNYTHVDSFIVYREISTNNYKRIGAVSHQALSSFTDTDRTKYFPNTGDPNTGTYRYKLQIRNECGNYSSLSPYHNTIFIISNNGTFNWPQLYTIEGSTNPVNSYVLMRDDNSNGNWNIINSVSGTQQLITDPAYAAFKDKASYRIGTFWNITCSPTFLNSQEQKPNSYTTSFSNIHRKEIISGINVLSEDHVSLELYPNPFDTYTNIIISGLNGSYKAQLKLLDYLGKEIKSQAIENGTHRIERGHLAGGMYFLEIHDHEKIVAMKKIVIRD